MMGGICVYCGKILNDVSKEICDKCEDETASCKWCDNADRMETTTKTISDSGKWVGIKRFSTSKSNYCPNCGRKLTE